MSFQNCNSHSSATPTQQSTAIQKGQRVLGLDINSSAQDTNFNQGFAEAQAMGAVGVDMSFHPIWPEKP